MSYDDEREALIDVLVMTKLSDYAATDMSTIHQAVDAILAAGFRRSAVPEWEYGWKSHFPNGEEYEWSECKSRESAEETIRTLQEQEDRAEDQIGGRLLYTLWKRTKEKAGPWEAVTE